MSYSADMVMQILYAAYMSASLLHLSCRSAWKLEIQAMLHSIYTVLQGGGLSHAWSQSCMEQNGLRSRTLELRQNMYIFAKFAVSCTALPQLHSSGLQT